MDISFGLRTSTNMKENDFKHSNTHKLIIAEINLKLGTS